MRKSAAAGMQFSPLQKIVGLGFRKPKVSYAATILSVGLRRDE
jgi:hypothetical protein